MDNTMMINLLSRAAVLLLLLPVHEYAHARVSYALGDPTAANDGRLDLNRWCISILWDRCSCCWWASVGPSRYRWTPAITRIPAGIWSSPPWLAPLPI